MQATRKQSQRSSRLTIKGQITLPKIYRDALGWGPRTKLAFVKERDGIKIVAVRDRSDPGTELVNKLRGAGNRRYTTAQIMTMTRGEG